MPWLLNSTTGYLLTYLVLLRILNIYSWPLIISGEPENQAAFNEHTGAGGVMIIN